MLGFIYLNSSWVMDIVSAQSLQWCLTLCDPMDYSPPGSSVHGISQARILEWVTISFSRGSSQLRDETQVSHIAGRFFTTELPGKPRHSLNWSLNNDKKIHFLIQKWISLLYIIAPPSVSRSYLHNTQCNG